MKTIRRLAFPVATFAIAQTMLGCPTTNTPDDSGPVAVLPDAAVLTDAAVLPDASLDGPLFDAHVGPDANIDPCAAGDIDLLFMIDNSGSMREEQANLISELPRLVRVLSTGDRDGDGVRDFTPARSLHVGFVTSDMGSGDETGVRTCTPGLGDDGLLQSRSRAGAPPCMPTYPSGTLEFLRGGDASVFATTLGCVADLGTAGCGFEQQLEAPLKALTPNRAERWTAEGYSPPRFFDPVAGLPNRLVGHGSGPNASFLRPDSTLAIVLLSDEEDCSVADYSIFGGAGMFMGIPPNLRCNLFSEELSIVYPASRYVDGFIGLRRDPSQLIFSVIAGIPPSTESLAAAGNFAAVLADPGMSPRVDATGTLLEPSCSSANGVAFPPIRMVRVAAGLAARGASVNVSSICNSAYGGSIDAIIRRLSTVPSSCE